jgi:1,4-alpha-glucan branching enzyme
MTNTPSRLRRFVRSIAISSLVLTTYADLSFADAWLDDDEQAIWQRAPGVYKEGGQWYVIFHAAAGDTDVKIQGEFTNGVANAIPLTRTPDGKLWWFKGPDSSFSRAPRNGDEYRFSLVRGGDTLTFPDPAARWMSGKDIATANSKIYIGSEQPWTVTNWQRPTADKLNIYQLHASRFTGRNPGNAFQEVTEELDNDGVNDYINELGPTAVQLLPVNEFTTSVSWGYNPNYYYAIESSFGGPVHFKHLVDTAQQNGMEVIVDLVFNHLSNRNESGNVGPNTILHAIDAETYIDGETDWGPMINFNNDVAKHFFIQNVLYLAKEFRITGFRFDATNVIHNPDNHHIVESGDGGGLQFLRELYGKVKAYDPNIWITYEEFPDWFGITAENFDGTTVEGSVHGPADSQWVDAFHDNFKAVLTSQTHLDELRNVFAHYGDGWEDGTVYTESHDEVGNTDDRIAKRGRDRKGWEMNQISGAGTLMSRGIPMVFMGQEAGELRQFYIDAWDEADKLDLNDYESNEGRQKILRWFQKMNKIRSDDLTNLAKGDVYIHHIHDINGVFAFTRANGKYLIVLNFLGKSWENYNVGVSGRYIELANTSWPIYNLNNYPFRSRGGEQAHDISDLHIPAYGAVVLKRVD